MYPMVITNNEINNNQVLKEGMQLLRIQYHKSKICNLLIVK